MSSPPGPAARIAVAVVSYETRDLLATALEALAGDPRLEVWVVDNGSRDGSADLVRERFPWVHLEARTDNLGFGRAVNLVAGRTAHAGWLAIANADTAPAPGAIDALLAAAEADPLAGALAPRLVLPDGSTQHSVRPFPTVAGALGYAVGLRRLWPAWGERQCLGGSWDPDRPRRVPWAVGAFLLVRREAWDAVGGFDPAQWLYAEDLELGWRLRRAGWRTRYVPDAVVHHAESASTSGAWADARTERWMAATYDWLLRRRGPFRARAIAAINVTGDLARWRGSRRPDRVAFRHWAAHHAIGLRAREDLRRRLPRPPGTVD